MKNLKISVLFYSVLFCFVLSSCSDSSENKDVIATSKETLIELKQEATTTILTMGKDKNFKKFVLEECLKQSHGDYNVSFSRIIEKYKSENSEFANTLAALRLKMKALNGGIEPILFYPRAETIENDFNFKKTGKMTLMAEQTIGVYADELSPSYACPGYIVQSDTTLEYYDEITEEYAWENDVWVIGEEEIVSPENMVSGDSSSLTARYNGQSEYGGIIQITNLNAVEPWISGKLELKFYVIDANGKTISDRAFGKRKRSNFRSQKWCDFGHFIANWNTLAFGSLMCEKWIEENGGKSKSISITIPPPTGQTGPTTTINIPSRERDKDLGLATIQFSDAITQIYNLSNANIKRKN